MAGTREDPDIVVKKMARALREGWKMLDLACPACNNPVFQLQNGDKACVVCERRVVLESELKEPADGMNETSSVESLEPDEKTMPPDQPRTHLETTANNIFDELRRVSMKKLAGLVDELEHARTVEHISLVNKCIAETLSILERVKFS